MEEVSRDGGVPFPFFFVLFTTWLINYLNQPAKKTHSGQGHTYLAIMIWEMRKSFRFVVCWNRGSLI